MSCICCLTNRPTADLEAELARRHRAFKVGDRIQTRGGFVGTVIHRHANLAVCGPAATGSQPLIWWIEDHTYVLRGSYAENLRHL